MKNSKYLLICLIIAGTQNSIHAMDSSKSNVNPKKVLTSLAVVLTTANMFLYSQNNKMQSPIETSLHTFANVKQATVPQNDNNSLQGYYYLRGSASSFNCDDDECTHIITSLNRCDDDKCNC